MWQHDFLKSVGFSHYFCEVKLVMFGPFSDRIRLRSLFGRSCLSPDSLFCRTWGPILAYARFWSNFHPFFTFSSFSLFSTAVKIVALVYAKRTSVIKSPSVSQISLFFHFAGIVTFPVGFVTILEQKTHFLVVHKNAILSFTNAGTRILIQLLWFLQGNWHSHPNSCS